MHNHPIKYNSFQAKYKQINRREDNIRNELFSLCKKMNIDYETVVRTVMKDNRIGKSHFEVPGPDGNYGFGGSCFPKDLSALISVFKNNNVESVVLNSVWNRNNTIDRKEKDWENLKGRAIEE